MSHQVIYICLYSQVNISFGETLNIGKVAEIEGSPDIIDKISGIPLSLELKEGEDRKVLSSLFLVKLIKLYNPEIDIRVLGLTDTIIKTKRGKSSSNNPIRLAFIYLVCLLLFIGSAMAIMNFHADVSMPTVHQQIFQILTGEERRNPLVLQVPYSIGIGLGMFVFFNRLFKKRINKEPSPLEVEMFLYEENVNKYVRASQNKVKSQINNKDQE